MSKSIKIVTLSVLMTACILLGYGIFGKTVNDTTKQNQELNTSRNYLIEQIGNLQADYDTLTESYKVLYNNSDTKTKEIITLSNQIESLKKDLSTSQAKVDSLEIEKTTLQNQVNSLTADVNSKSLQITELQSQLETAQQSAESNAQTIESLETQIESLNDELAKTKQDLEIANSELETTKQNLEIANSNLSTKTSELETLQAKYDEQTKLLTEAQQTIVILNASIVEKDERINELVEKLNSDDHLFMDLMNGSITEIKAVDFPENLTTIRPYQFYNCTNLTSVELPTTVTSIGEYAFRKCSNLATVNFSNTITSYSSYAFENCTSLTGDLVLENATVKDYAFCNTKISSLSGTVSSIGSQTFYNCNSLNSVDLKISGSVGDYNFSNANITSLTINPESVITSLGSYAFQKVGNNRSDIENNVFDLDFTKSTFASLGSYCFSNAKYLNITFPKTLTKISNSSQFSSSSYLNIYYSVIPELGGTGVFSSATNVKNFFPYELLKTATITANWSNSSILNTIYGYAPANTFNAGETLPENDSQGWSLTWYSDSAMTTPATTVNNADDIYYCSVGERVAVAVSSLTSYQATCTITDSTGKTYTQGDTVKVGTTLTITATGDTGFDQVYMFTLNGNAITSGATYTVSEYNISIVCIYYDGTNIPVNPNFADNTPAQIKVGIDTGVAKTLWKVGDKKQITLTDGQVVNIVLLDLQANRYTKSDGTGYSNGVLGIEQCIMQAKMNDTDTNAGGFAESKMYKETMSKCLELLPTEWQAIISTVKIASTIGNQSTEITYSDNKTFIASISEVFDPPYDTRYLVEGSVFDYYKNSGSGSNSIRIKTYNGSPCYYWLRSPSLSNSSTFMYVNTNGDWNNVWAGNSYGVSVCFAI